MRGRRRRRLPLQGSKPRSRRRDRRKEGGAETEYRGPATSSPSGTPTHCYLYADNHRGEARLEHEEEDVDVHHAEPARL